VKEIPVEVWHRYQAGDMDARRELIEAYLPLTRYVASQMSRKLPPSVEFDDLVSYGTLGLIDAIEKYDLDKGVRFGTYAVNRVRGAVLDELRSLDWVPRSVRTKARAVERAASSLSQSLGRLPSEDEMAETLGVDVSELGALLNDASATPIVGLEETITYEGGARQNLIDTIIDTRVDDPLSSHLGTEVAETVASVVAGLDERQRTILALYCVEELTLSEIGDVLGVTESRVCQMHTRTVSAIQGALEARGAGVVTLPS
jgi:RNA polymerase sigma factor FliA